MAGYTKHIEIGHTGLSVSRLGMGTGSLGRLYQVVSTEEALQTLRTAREIGINFFDTAPFYGAGLAESRLGMVMPEWQRENLVLSTKVGNTLRVDAHGQAIPDTPLVKDYSYDEVMRQVEASLTRLRTDHVDILYIHDPDDHYQAALDGAYRALDRLRAEKVIRAVGVGMNQSAMLTRFAREGDFDCFLLAGRYTLLDQTALADLLPVAAERGISIFIGGPLNSGILADPYAENPMFNYRPADVTWIRKAQKIDEVCRRFQVPLKAAAMQFPLAHPAVAAVITGARSAEEVKENAELLQFRIPPELWASLKSEGLISEEAAEARQ